MGVEDRVNEDRRDRDRRGTEGAQQTERGLGDHRRRFDELQTRFIDDPQAAVRDAETVVRQAVEEMFQSVRGRLDGLHVGEERAQDTEGLRRAMQGYRDLLGEIGSESWPAFSKVETGAERGGAMASEEDSPGRASEEPPRN